MWKEFAHVCVKYLFLLTALTRLEKEKEKKIKCECKMRNFNFTFNGTLHEKSNPENIEAKMLLNIIVS